MALAVDHAGMAKKWAMALKKLLLTAQSNCPQKDIPDDSSAEQPRSSSQSDKPSAPQYFLPPLPSSNPG